METRRTYRTVGVVIAGLLMILCSTANAQDNDFRARALRWGGHIGFSYNMASLGLQNLHEPFPNFDKPNTDNEKVNGTGYGAYGGIVLEYLSNSWWGIQIKASYDMRDATVRDIFVRPETEFITHMSYLTFEPALRIDQHLLPNLSLAFGPMIAANLEGMYDYKADKDGLVTDAGVKIPDRSVVSLGLTVGMAYDMEVNRGRDYSLYLSPFVDYSWIASQRKSVVTAEQNSVQDIWSTQSIRAGFRLSWESRTAVDEKLSAVPYVAPAPARTPVVAPEPASENRFYAILPDGNLIVAKRIEGYFPISPYVFFDKQNQDIPARYTRLTHAEAMNFKETDLGDFSKGGETVKETNVDKLMLVYYNVLNVYGNRLRLNPGSRVTLMSSDPQSWDATAAANTIKNYFINTFDIAADRISIDTEPPLKPSGGMHSDPDAAAMLADENRRVGFRFTDPTMYRPLAYTITDESPFENDIIINISNEVRLSTWKVSITGENRTVVDGPFRTRTAAIDLTPLVMGLREGKYTVAVTMALQDGREVTERMDFMVYKGTSIKNATRYLMVFDYNKSDAVRSYEALLRTEIVPGMVDGSRAIIHGHTDVIGSEADNQTLSQSRSDEVKRIVEDELVLINKDVRVTSVGIGEQPMQYTFDNRFPEGRMYNRNVFVEILR